METSVAHICTLYGAQDCGGILERTVVGRGGSCPWGGRSSVRESLVPSLFLLLGLDQLIPQTRELHQTLVLVVSSDVCSLSPGEGHNNQSEKDKEQRQQSTEAELSGMSLTTSNSENQGLMQMEVKGKGDLKWSGGRIPAPFLKSLWPWRHRLTFTIQFLHET